MWQKYYIKPKSGDTLEWLGRQLPPLPQHRTWTMEPCKMTDLFLVKIKLAISGRPAAARCRAVMSQAAAASARVHKLFYLGQF